MELVSATSDCRCRCAEAATLAAAAAPLQQQRHLAAPHAPTRMAHTAPPPHTLTHPTFVLKASAILVRSTLLKGVVYCAHTRTHTRRQQHTHTYTQTAGQDTVHPYAKACGRLGRSSGGGVAGNPSSTTAPCPFIHRHHTHTYTRKPGMFLCTQTSCAHARHQPKAPSLLPPPSRPQPHLHQCARLDLPQQCLDVVMQVDVHSQLRLERLQRRKAGGVAGVVKVVHHVTHLWRQQRVSTTSRRQRVVRETSSKASAAGRLFLTGNTDRQRGRPLHCLPHVHSPFPPPKHSPPPATLSVSPTSGYSSSNSLNPMLLITCTQPDNSSVAGRQKPVHPTPATHAAGSAKCVMQTKSQGHNQQYAVCCVCDMQTHRQTAQQHAVG